ncbi:TetR/AcrR family transcriptional regulator [Cohnella sp. REN36]|uniref:TetR/AcrR family transcriptional regulator n=1 Tax=Cohnella sp. REN36 TaxID=2887347 RepID=UPI001D154131|nr:TetR/AcrR family transcriptional regulator [Cohnella sp. REN36]MCC3374387.1 TetR/AcrR family transcriptional regulator [Cohnella sp. REN36]
MMTNADRGGKRGTKDRLLYAAVDLIAEQGYKGTTTKEIAAAASVSEMTLFRHFGSKQSLLEEALDRFHYAGEMRKIFAEKLVGDLYTDLRYVAAAYHEIMHRNRKILHIIMKEGKQIPGFVARAHKHPQALREMLTDYLKRLQREGKIIPIDAVTHSAAFLWMQHGAFLNNQPGSSDIADIPIADFVESSVQLFARALTP